MKTLLTTTALALLIAGPLLAQQTPPPVAPTQDPLQQTAPVGADAQTQDGMSAAHTLFLAAGEAAILHASDLIGMDVHSSEADYSMYGADPVATSQRTQWDAIGSINDILITPEGQAQAVLVDIGGFLGMGAHTVALDMSQVHFLRDESGVQFVAVNSTREALEAAPAYERQEEMAATPMADPAATPMADPAATTPNVVVAQPGDPMGVMRPAFTRDGYQDVDYAQLTADDLQGATVYDGNDESIGNIGELLLASDGAIDQAIVDVGGFLGLGVHSVALDFDELQIMRGAEGTDVRVYIDQTRENLEQRPAYEG